MAINDALELEVACAVNYFQFHINLLLLLLFDALHLTCDTTTCKLQKLLLRSLSEGNGVNQIYRRQGSH